MEGPQSIRIDVDLILLDESADRRHFGDPGHRIQLVADEPVLEGPQLAQRMARALHGVPEDMADAGGVGAQRRRHTRRQGLRHQTHALEHPRARKVQIDLVLEDDIDHRKPERRLRSDDADAGQALQVHRQRDT